MKISAIQLTANEKTIFSKDESTDSEKKLEKMLSTKSKTGATFVFIAANSFSVALSTTSLRKIVEALTNDVGWGLTKSKEKYYEN